MKKRTEAFSVLLSATFLLYFFGEKVDFVPHFFRKNLPFPPKNIIENVALNKTEKATVCFFIYMCVCKISLDLIERFLLYVYLTEHPEIQDRCRYLGNATLQKKLFASS